tara:strand:+ start:66 stop:404 length:339 start_codon:yes stop_codon:yes gene_type:complete
MSNRYANRGEFENRHKLYRNMAKARGVNFFNHYDTPTFKSLDKLDFARVKKIGHIWNFGDRYYKLAYQYYGDPSVWWLIAWFNQKPTEADLKIGDAIYIPLPLESVLSLYNG